jgi:hypothetical protein
VLKLFTKSGDALLSASVRADANAPLGRQLFLRRLWAQGVAIGIVSVPLLVATETRAGEQIKITTPSNKAGLPTELPKEQIIPPSDIMRSRINGGESGQGPVLPAPNQPAIMRDPKLEELYFRKKNWMMYDSPNAVDRDEVGEVFGVRKYDLDKLDKRPKGDLERIYEASKDAKNARAHAAKDGIIREGRARDGLSGPNDLDAKGRLSSREDPQNGEPGGIIQELNPALLFNWTPAPDGLAQFGSSLNRNSILPRGIGEPAFGQKLPMPSAPGQTQRDIERLWDSKKAPLGRLTDPINDQSDVTRSIMNPITARKPSIPAPESAQPRIGETAPAFGSIAPLAPRSDYFNGGRERTGAGPGFTSPVATPVSSPVIQPKPMILEIPRPRF